MKLVIAYVRPEMLDSVIYALHSVKGLRGASVFDGEGFGAWRMDATPEAIEHESSNFRPNRRLEIVCSEEVAPAVIEAVQANAHTGIPGDGLVYTLDVGNCMKIRTGEMGI